MNRFIPIIFILVAGAVFFLYVNPTYTGKTKELQREVKDLQSTIAKAKQFQAEQTRLVTERESLSAEDLRRLKVLLPDNVDNVQLILDVDGIATRNGARINGIAVEKVGDSAAADGSIGQGVVLKEEKPFGVLALSFDTTATYDQFKRFLQDMEQSLRTLDVTKIAFSESETGVYTFTTKVKVYWLK